MILARPLVGDCAGLSLLLYDCWPPKKEERARAIVECERSGKSARFVKVKGASPHLDDTALARARSPVGLKGYVSNVPVTVMAASQVIAGYPHLWKVEKLFRVSKSGPAAQPIFHRQRSFIEAHLTRISSCNVRVAGC